MQYVGRHMYEMARRRRKGAKPGGCRKALFRVWRSFHRVNVIMKRTHMHWIALEYALQDGDDFHRSLGRRSIGAP